MRYLLLLSSLFFFRINTVAQSCTFEYPLFQTVTYQASIDVLDKHLSGLLIFSKVEEDTTRCVFMNEMGITFYSMSFTKEQYFYHYVMPSLNKKGVKIALAKDMGMILMQGIFKQTISTNATSQVFKLKRKGYVRYTFENCKKINKIENYGKKNVVSIVPFYQSKSDMPDSLSVQHHAFDFSIRLKQLYDTTK
ncbi:MAG: hypothetical protein R2831_04905 [Chitinophagaceae bacterium]